MNYHTFLKCLKEFHYLYSNDKKYDEFFALGIGGFMYKTDNDNDDNCHLLHFHDVNDSVWSHVNLSLIDIPLIKYENHNKATQVILLHIEQHTYLLDCSLIQDVIVKPYNMKELNTKLDEKDELLCVEIKLSYSSLSFILIIESATSQLDMYAIFTEAKNNMLYIKKKLQKQTDEYYHLHKEDKKNFNKIKKLSNNYKNYYYQSYNTLHASLTSKTHYCLQHVNNNTQHHHQKQNCLTYNPYYMNNALLNYLYTAAKPMWLQFLIHLIQKNETNSMPFICNNNHYLHTLFNKSILNLTQCINEQYQYQLKKKKDIISPKRLQFLLSPNENLTQIMLQQINQEYIGTI